MIGATFTNADEEDNMMNKTSKLAFIALMLQGTAHAACEFDIEVVDGFTFRAPELTVESSCESVTINLAHTGQMPAAAMGHNWVLAETSDVEGVAEEGLIAGLENSWVKPDDERVIAHTKLIGGGESDSVTFEIGDMSADADYTFICSAPGHWQIMQGKLLIE